MLWFDLAERVAELEHQVNVLVKIVQVQEQINVTIARELAQLRHDQALAPISPN